MRRLSSLSVLCLVLAAITLTLPTENLSAQQQTDSPFAASRRLLEQGKFAEAIPQYQRALSLDEDLVDAHYRLGQAYVRIGQRDKGQEQLTVYQKLREQHLADLEKQRADIRQFVYNEKDAAKP